MLFQVNDFFFIIKFILMKIELIRLDDVYYMLVINEDGNMVEIDGFFKVGGSNQVM